MTWGYTGTCGQRMEETRPLQSTEGSMKSTADRSASDPLDPDRILVLAGDPALDVPGRLAGRIGELYASEERLRRRERTDRLLRQAAEPAQD